MPSSIQIAQAADSLTDPNFSNWLSAKDAQIKVIHPSFLGDLELWRVERFLPRGPLVFYLGIDAHGTATLLTNHPQAFTTWISAANSPWVNMESALEWVEFYVEATRNRRKRLQLVRSQAELPWRPNLSPDFVQQRTAFESEFSITAPTTEPDGDQGWIVTAYFVVDMGLEQRTYSVSSSGAVELQSQVFVAKTLPFTYVG